MEQQEATVPREWAVEELDDFACASAYGAGLRVGRAINRIGTAILTAVLRGS